MTDRPNPLKAVRESVDSRPCRALTLVELLVVVVVLGVLLAMLLPGLARRNQRSSQIHCAGRLKQIGLSFRFFSLDNNDRFPPGVGTNEGGVKEWVNSGPGGTGDPTRTYWVFACMSNELATPKILVCPEDKDRQVISNFHALAYTTPLLRGGQNAALSYFVNLDADETRPTEILVGDRNISTVTNARHARDYDAFFGVEHRIRPRDAEPGGGYANLDFHPTLHYYDRNTKTRQGNLAMADGSVQQASGARARGLILASTNDLRLLFPFVPGKNE